MLRRSRRW